MSQITTIKLYKTTYNLDPSGFWICSEKTDPYSATITTGELYLLVDDYRVKLKDAQKRISAELEVLNAFSEYHS